MTDVEVYRRVKLRIVEFLNHVRANDADLRRPVCDECGDIKGAHADDRDILMIGREFERPAMLVMEIRFRFYAHAGKQRQGFIQDSPLRDGDDQRLCLDESALLAGADKGNKRVPQLDRRSTSMKYSH